MVTFSIATDKEASLAELGRQKRGFLGKLV